MTKDMQEALRHIALGLREMEGQLEMDMASIAEMRARVDSYRRQLDDLRGEMTPELVPQDITERGLYS